MPKIGGISTLILRSRFTYMFRRRNKTSSAEEGKEPSQASPVPCSNCIKLMQEISQLREENNLLKCDKKRKCYTIAPTLYTYYKSNILKNRVSRYSCCVKWYEIELPVRLHSLFWSPRRRKTRVPIMKKSLICVLSHSRIHTLRRMTSSISSSNSVSK